MVFSFTYWLNSESPLLGLLGQAKTVELSPGDYQSSGKNRLHLNVNYFVNCKSLKVLETQLQRIA